MDDNKPAMPQEIADEKLEGVAGGGLLRTEKDGKYYVHLATSYLDWCETYLCPNCGRTLEYNSRFGSLFCTFHCYTCDETWFFESKLIPNLASHVWKEIPYEEYKALHY